MSVIVSLMGGLGFFLYGMKLMSEGLQKVAGSKMRSILEVFTKNRVIGLLVGIFFTALIQSSNATTRYGGQLRKLRSDETGTGSWKLSPEQTSCLTVTGQRLRLTCGYRAALFVIIGVRWLCSKQSDDQPPSRRDYLSDLVFCLCVSRYLRSLNEAKRISGRQRPRIPWRIVSCVLSQLGGYRDSAGNSATVEIIMLLAREGSDGTIYHYSVDAASDTVIALFFTSFGCRCKTCGMHTCC